MRRGIVAAALTAAVLMTAAPAMAGPVARNDAEFAALGRVFPEIEHSLTYTKYTDEFVPAIQYLEHRYPDRLDVRVYGKSVENRDLFVVELTDENSPVPYSRRKQVLVDAGIHASERSAVEGPIRFIEDLASRGDPLLRTTVLVVTFPNPDGWARIEPDGLRSGTRNNANNQNLNREFRAAGWIRSSYDPMREPEAVNTVNLFESARYGNTTWAHAVHCFTIEARSYIQLLIPSAENDLAENVQTIAAARRFEPRVAAATAGREFDPRPLRTGMYGTILETRRRLDAGYAGNYYAAAPPIGLGKPGFTLEHLGCEFNPWTPAVERYQVQAIRAELRLAMELANERAPRVELDLRGKAGYLHDPAVVTDADGSGYVPRNETEASYPQQPYRATRMRFFGDLDRFTHDLRKVEPDRRGRIHGLRGLRSLVVTEHADGVDRDELREYVRHGGTLVLTDGALRVLPEIADVPASAITRATGVAARMSEQARDRAHPLLHGLDRGDHYAEQLYEPAPLGFSLAEQASPWWHVSADAFAAAGGRTAALDPGGSVIVGDLPLGRGRIVLVGGLLPQPTEAYFHPYGLQGHGVTYTGYQILVNALGGCVSVDRGACRRAVP